MARASDALAIRQLIALTGTIVDTERAASWQPFAQLTGNLVIIVYYPLYRLRDAIIVKYK